MAPGSLVKGGTTYRILSDQVGSVRLVVNATTGAIAQRIDYDAFGVVTLDTDPGFQPFGFAGGLTDRDTGLVRFGARDYDPRIGRWTSKDPIRFDGGDTGLYSYTLGDPVGHFDAAGLDTASLGVSLHFQFGPVNANFFAGFAVDGRGGLAGFYGGGGGLGAGAAVSGGLSLATSNADSVCDLAGPFNNVSATAGAGAAFSLDAFAGSDRAGKPVLGSGITLGVGDGVASSTSITYTNVRRFR